jgi:hypothetical protein
MIGDRVDLSDEQMCYRWNGGIRSSDIKYPGSYTTSTPARYGLARPAPISLSAYSRPALYHEGFCQSRSSNPN